MAKTAPKFHSKFKMADFLLGLGYGSKRLFCTSWPDTCVYQISLIYVKVKGGGIDFENC